MIPAIQELNFPKKDGKQYATLTHATAKLDDMGEKTITTQVKIDGNIVPDFSYDWEVEFQGEKYIMPLRIPAGSKGNEALRSEIDLTFQHWAIYQLKRWTFVTIQPIEAGTYIADEEVATVQLNLKDFCDLFGQVLEYYFGGAITIDLNPAWEYDKTATLITIDHTYIWNVLIKFHELFGVRWEIIAKPARNYLLGTLNKWRDINIGRYENTYYDIGDLSSLGLSAGDVMTYSVDIDAKSGQKDLRVYIWVNDASDQRLSNVYGSIVEKGTSGRSSVTFTLPEGAHSLHCAISNRDNTTATSNTTERYRSDILCKGTGTMWYAAPEDSGQSATDGGYVIRVGYPTTEVDHIFEYGFEGGLLKLERQVQSEEIRNMIKGRGGETNIPFRYFKDKDPKNPDFKPDPDWVEELANIYFTNLRGATFRSYVQGWKAAHRSKYPGYKAVGINNAYAPWAYRKGFTDSKFHPEEFVADEIILNPEEGDSRVDLFPGYSPYIKKGSSIDKYGPLPATLDNHDDIYPTIQGTGLDIAVDVEQIVSDDVAESVESDAKTSDFKENDKPKVSETLNGGQRKTVEAQSGYFYVENGKHADLDEGPKTFSVSKDEKRLMLYIENDKIKFVENYQIRVEDYLIEAEGVTLTVVNAHTGEERSASGIPTGTYYFRIKMTLHNTSKEKLNVTVACENPKVISATLPDKWSNTFNIWVKDIWNTRKGVDEDGNPINETNEQYSERVWRPVLGDREGNEAAVVFTSGELVHEDYEFKIPKGAWPVYDTSKTYKDEDGETHTSHWRITLAKSDAELEATGLYVPSTKKQGKAGDTFVFIGTEMTHVPYVVKAEIALDDWKKDHLGKVKEIKPTFVVTTDRVRLNNEGRPDALINQLRVGNTLRLADKRFIQPMGDRAYETLYLQSLTYTFREPSKEDAALNPDVEMVLSNEYTTSVNPVSIMQGEISSMQRLLGSISNVEQIVRAVGDRLYLRKDGISDRSLSPTQFFSLLTSGDFRAGLVGGAGWGFYKDENGDWVLEADRVNVRQEMQVNTLVINQAEGRGGMEIDTAAFMEVIRVVETDNGYVCYFDQKDGSVANLFRVDDVAYCNRWTPENKELKFYKRRVVAVGVDNITLTKERTESSRPADWTDSGVDGTGIPAEKDNIIHFGNYTDKTRQYVKVRDVVGGGYERYIEELNSVNAAGVEYYFVGKQAGKSRWFVGNKDLIPYSGKGDGSYIEYKDKEFHLNNVRLSVGTRIGDKALGEYIRENGITVYEVVSDTGSAIPADRVGEQISLTKYKTDGNGRSEEVDGWLWVRQEGEETWRRLGSDETSGGSFTLKDGVSYVEVIYSRYEDMSDILDSRKFRVLDAPGATMIGALNLVTKSEGPYRIMTASQGWFVLNPRCEVTGLEVDTEYILRAETDGVWANPSIPDQSAEATLLALTFPDGREMIISDNSTGKVSGTPFMITDPTLPLDGVGIKLFARKRGRNVSRIMIVKGDGIVSEWEASPEDSSYLTKALEQSTTIDRGLILTTHIATGYTDSEGVRYTLAGINGTYEESWTPAIWAGGEMLDAEDGYDNAATYMIRMDGTGYACGNTVKFLKEEMRIGTDEEVRLTAEGLSLYDGSGEKCYSLSNVNVVIPETVMRDPVRVVESNISISYRRSKTKPYLTASMPEINIGNFDTDRQLDLHIYIPFQFAAGVTTLPPSPPTMRLRITAVGSGEGITRNLTAKYDESLSGFYFDAKITASLTPGNYRVNGTISVPSSGDPGNMEDAQANIEFKSAASAQIENGHIQGTNGFMSVLGSGSSILAHTESAILLKCGSSALRLTTSEGIESWDGNKWNKI